MFASSDMEGLDPQAYTSGRWLRDNETQQNARHIAFDFDALCRRMVDLCPGATAISSCEKKEGGFNRVFVFTTDNGERLVARLPFKLSGPPGMTTQSEVATISYIREKTSIPVPRVLDWSADAHTSIGAEYIITEHTKGVQLHQIWPKVAADKKIRCIDGIYQKMKEIANIRFPAYGSLYFANNSIAPSVTVPLDDKFCIGPHCNAMYWDCDPTVQRCYDNTKPNHGPWLDLPAYCDGLIDNGIARIPRHPDLQHKPRYQGSPSTHLSLLKSCRAVIKKMAEDPRILEAAVPLLFHPDLHKRNIFVSEDNPTEITGIIDWQSASMEPAFWNADVVPDFAESATDPSGKSDPNAELYQKAFEACAHFLVPKIGYPRFLDDSLFRPFRYSYRSWKDGAVVLRQELIETHREWAKLGLPGSCPFDMPTPEELTIHKQLYQRFVAAHELKRDLADLLNTATDGWVPMDAWEATVSAHKETYKTVLEDILKTENADEDEPIRTESDLREIWPFDLD